VESRQARGRSGLKEHSYQGLCWRGVNVGQERASNQQDGLGVCRAGLVQTGLGMASFFYTWWLSVLAQTPWRHWVINSCPGLKVLNMCDTRLARRYHRQRFYAVPCSILLFCIQLKRYGYLNWRRTASSRTLLSPHNLLLSSKPAGVPITLAHGCPSILSANAPFLLCPCLCMS
jgi:hypothetical protein